MFPFKEFDEIKEPDKTKVKFNKLAVIISIIKIRIELYYWFENPDFSKLILLSKITGDIRRIFFVFSRFYLNNAGRNDKNIIGPALSIISLKFNNIFKIYYTVFSVRYRFSK